MPIPLRAFFVPNSLTAYGAPKEQRAERAPLEKAKTKSNSEVRSAKCEVRSAKCEVRSAKKCYAMSCIERERYMRQHGPFSATC
jgi:hypothetical protein